MKISVWYGFRPQLQGLEMTLKINRNISTASQSYVAKELSGLLQQSHQATLSEVASRAHAVLVWGQDVIRHRRFLQHIGGDVLRRKTVSQSIN